ncbi:hypothetical protein H4582DRAFT_1955098 [Lactarius indigo]|nr:hypothetical protein H4582DRAFT_1955098 [Lactarius indigo]
MVSVLLNAGANVNARNTRGQTPVHLVSQGPYYSEDDGVGIARLLLEHGAAGNARDNNHATPSDLALYHRRMEVASLLLHYNGDANGRPVPNPVPRLLGLAAILQWAFSPKHT